MKLYFTFTRSKLFAILLLSILSAVLISRFCSAVSAGGFDGSTNAKRLEFIDSLGDFDVCEEASEKITTVPTEFSKVYERYNELQLDAGFDLRDYAGQKLKIYTYEYKNGNGAIHIMTHKGRIVGGDIADYAVDGVMLPLFATKGGEKDGKATT